MVKPLMWIPVILYRDHYRVLQNSTRRFTVVYSVWSDPTWAWDMLGPATFHSHHRRSLHG